MWSHIWLSVKHIFNHIHMRTLGNIRLPEADPTLMIMFLDFLERSISELLPVGIGNAICDYPYLRELASEHWSEHPWARPGWQCTRVQVICIPKPVSISHIPHPSIDPRLVGPESPLLQERNLKTLHLKPSTQGSRRIRRETLLPFLTIVDTTNKLVVSLVTTQTASTLRDRACAFPPVKNPPEISQFHSQLKFLCFGLLACDFSYWHGWVLISPFWMSSGEISRATHLVEGRWAWFHCLGFGMRCFKWALCMSLFSPLGKDQLLVHCSL